MNYQTHPLFHRVTYYLGAGPAEILTVTVTVTVTGYLFIFCWIPEWERVCKSESHWQSRSRTVTDYSFSQHVTKEN